MGRHTKFLLVSDNLGVQEKWGITMNYSIIITFFQNTNMLWHCIHALIDSLRGREDAEIVLINDNPSADLSTALEKCRFPVPFRLIQNSQNLGHAGACNIGAKNSNGRRLVFLDCDIIVTIGWLEALEQTFSTNTDCGAAMATILDFSNNQVVYAGMELYKSESIKPLQGASRCHPFLLEDHVTQIATSGCMMVHRAAFERAGGFDQIFFNSCNDLDFSMKLNNLKYRNYVSANSIVYHRGNVSGEVRFTSHIYARSYFFQKWRDEIEQTSRALTMLEHLYSQQDILSGDYLVIDFSSSLFSDDYIGCLCQAKDISQIDKYRIRCNQPKIIVTDYLQWDIGGLNTPILYFTDDYRRLSGNNLWFHWRTGKNDVIADWNGNLMRCQQSAADSEDIAEPS